MRLSDRGPEVLPPMGALPGLGGGNDGRLRPTRLAQDEVAVLCIDDDGVAFAELAVEDRHRKRILDATLDHAFQRTRAIGRVVPLVGNSLHRLWGQLELDPAIRQTLAQALQL